MVNGYVESSLKRNLKKKVKVTLGLLVTFLITGTVVFAEEQKKVIQEEHKNHWEWNRVDEAQKYLKKDRGELNIISEGQNSKKLSVSKESSKYTVKTTGFQNTNDKRNINININENILSEKTVENLNSSLTLVDNVLNKENIESNIKVVNDVIVNGQAGYDFGLNQEKTSNENTISNKGVIVIEKGEGNTSANQTAEVNSIAINKGEINKQTGKTGSKVFNYNILNSQAISGGSVAYNYGIVTEQSVYEDSLGYNYGIAGIQVANNNGIVYNYGIINSTEGQILRGTKEIYNYGIISGTTQGGGQIIESSAGGSVYNYGVIKNISNKLSGAQTVKSKNITNNNIYNYGIIEGIDSENRAGQYLSNNVENNNFYNFGKILVKNGGQYINLIDFTNSKNNNMYNYGVIESEDVAQILKGNGIRENKIFNYGTINAGSGKGQYLENSGEIYNYGIINTNGTDYAITVRNGVNEKYLAENYGVINVSNGKAFEGDIKNRGFVISENGTIDNTNNVWTGENYGVILTKGLTLANGSTDENQINSHVIDLSNEDGKIELTDSNIITGESTLKPSEDKVTVFLKNKTASLTGNKYNNKNILAVTDNQWNGGTIIEADDELSLVNTIITGYFAGTKGGTVLGINSDLTLIGDTAISAIKGENVGKDEEVYALSIKDGAMLTFYGNKTQINGKINGEEGGIINVASKEAEFTGEIGILKLRNADKEMLESTKNDAKENYTDVILGNTGKLTLGKLELSFRGTAEGQTNKVHLTEDVIVKDGIDGTKTAVHEEDKNITGIGAENKIDLTVDNISNISGNISLGQCDDILTIINKEYSGVLDGKDGNDILKINADTLKRTDVDENLNYNIKNIETIELSSEKWTFGDKLSINHDDKKVDIKTAGTILSYIDGNGKGSLHNNGNAELTVIGKDKDNTGTVKYLMGNNFTVKDKIVLDDIKIGENAKAEGIIIYNSSINNDGTATLTLKTAEDMNITQANEKRIYDIFLKGIGKDTTDNLKDKFNSFTSEQQVIDLIRGTETSVKAYYTAGYIVTKNIADTYSSIFDNFDKKAGKGEWLAQGKYINSDTEFDGGNEVKGFDGDITGTAGMIEYGVDEQTAYGIVFGKGETKVEIDGGSSLDGDNIYIGGYVKYRTEKGVDLIGSIGIADSDLDSRLSNELTLKDYNYGKDIRYFDGSADSKAIIFSLIGKKDFKIAETLKLQPKAGLKYNLIKQDDAINEGMGFRIAGQDVTIFEAVAGMGLVKDIKLSYGNLLLNAGVEYTFSDASKYDEMEYTLYGEKLELENSEIADNVGKFYTGFDYEHENGVGFNGKYEMMWSDKGDDSRITAGVSYRF